MLLPSKQSWPVLLLYPCVYSSVAYHWPWSVPHWKHLFLLSELLCSIAPSCSMTNREHSSYCCVFSGTWILSRCLAMVIFVRISLKNPFPAWLVVWRVNPMDREASFPRKRIVKTAWQLASIVSQWVPLDSDPEITALARTSSNCKEQTRPLVRTPHINKPTTVRH
jgi:hypothetical protein